MTVTLVLLTTSLVITLALPAAMATGHPFGGIVSARGGGDPGGHLDTPGVQDHQGRVL